MTVHLVGAGPGDPELLTVRAARLLADADVVVHDRLASLATRAGPAGGRADRRRQAARRAVPQENINALLVQLGRQGLEVVRLKGGDPFVFGRGGEEALALGRGRRHVHRGARRDLGRLGAGGGRRPRHPSGHLGRVHRGHRPPDDRAESVDWEALARVGGTIIVLMGVAHRGSIAERLMAGGLGRRHAGRRGAQRHPRRPGGRARPARRAGGGWPRTALHHRDRRRGRPRRHGGARPAGCRRRLPSCRADRPPQPASGTGAAAGCSRPRTGWRAPSPRPR